MNIPTDPDVAGGASGEYSRDVTTIPPEPGVENSTAPSELGTPNNWLLMSSNAFDSRGDNVKTCGGTADAHPKHRYTAVTVITDVYDVLKTRTSEKNGATGRTTDAATGNVTVSATSGHAPASNSATGNRAFPPIFRISREFIAPIALGTT
jgi:hypothetical protein